LQSVPAKFSELHIKFDLPAAQLNLRPAKIGVNHRSSLCRDTFGGFRRDAENDRPEACSTFSGRN
jgi:hypothetical protein